jgi:hypothetical protein
MGRIEKKRNLRRPARAGQDQNAPAGVGAQNSKRNSQTDLLTQNSEKNSETRHGRPSLRAPRRVPRFASGANTGESTGFASTAGSDRGSGHEKSLANLKPWPKGVSGNPGGRPKRDAAAEIAQAVFEKNPEAIYAAMLKTLQRGNPRAFAVLADRAFGKLKEQVEMTHDDIFAGRTSEELEFFAINGYWPNDNVGGE